MGNSSKSVDSGNSRESSDSGGINDSNDSDQSVHSGDSGNLVILVIPKDVVIFDMNIFGYSFVWSLIFKYICVRFFTGAFLVGIQLLCLNFF